MTRATTRWIGRVLLALYFLAGLTSGRGLVLCFEPDGHVSLEMVDDCGGCCALEDGRDGSGARLSDCECSDVPVSIAESGQVKLGVVQVDAPLLRARGSTAPPPAPRRALGANELPRTHASQTLAALRCIVLLV